MEEEEEEEEEEEQQQQQEQEEHDDEDDNISKFYTFHFCFKNGSAKSTQLKVNKHSMHFLSPCNRQGLNSRTVIHTDSDPLGC